MSSAEALPQIEAIVAGGGDVDDELRRVVAALHERAGYAWAGVFFLEDAALSLGPHAGSPDETSRTSVPVRWNGDTVAELAVDGAPDSDAAFLERVAELVAGHCLVGWDTGGEPWVS
jgi:hypothetical protein